MPMLRYWDANAFLGYFNREDEEWKKDRCESVLHHAEAGRLLIVTSYLTYIEVIKMKGKAAIPGDDKDKIKKFFQHEYIIPRIVDRQIAELARDLVWKYNVWPKDAIHAATAVKLKMRYLDSFDSDLIKLNGKIGDPPLVIDYPPEMPHQASLAFPDEVSDDGEDDADVADGVDDESEADE